MSFQKVQVSFPTNFASIFSVIKHNSSLLFLAQTYTLVKSSPLKCKFLRFSSARVTIRQIPHVNSELTSQFLLKFFIILHCHGTKILCTFYAHTFSALDKRIPSRSPILDFRTCSGKNLLNSSCMFESQVSFLSNFVSILIAIKHNSSVLYFTLNIICFGQNQSIKVQYTSQEHKLDFLQTLYQS